MSDQSPEPIFVQMTLLDQHGHAMGPANLNHAVKHAGYVIALLSMTPSRAGVVHAVRVTTPDGEERVANMGDGGLFVSPDERVEGLVNVKEE